MLRIAWFCEKFEQKNFQNTKDEYPANNTNEQTDTVVNRRKIIWQTVIPQWLEINVWMMILVKVIVEVIVR